MSASNIENSLIRSGHDRRIVVLYPPRPEYPGTLSVGMLVLDKDFPIHSVNRRGSRFLTGFGPPIGASFAQVFESDFTTFARRLMTGETLRVRDRMGSAVSMRCVADRATFAMAGRGGTTAAPAARPAPDLYRDVVINDSVLRRVLAALPAAAQRGGGRGFARRPAVPAGGLCVRPAPPLRQRSDLAALVLRLLVGNDRARHITPKAMDRLAAHVWPGNIHELRAVLARADLRCAGGQIDVDDLDDLPDGDDRPLSVCPACTGNVWKEQQCRSVRDLVSREGGGISKAVRQLGPSCTTIYTHLEAAGQV